MLTNGVNYRCRQRKAFLPSLISPAALRLFLMRGVQNRRDPIDEVTQQPQKTSKETDKDECS